MKRKVMAMILMCALLAVNLTGCGNRTADEGQVQEQGQTEGTDNAQGDAEQEQEEPAQEEVDGVRKERHHVCGQQVRDKGAHAAPIRSGSRPHIIALGSAPAKNRACLRFNSR